jgi:hypothetical protein
MRGVAARTSSADPVLGGLLFKHCRTAIIRGISRIEGALGSRNVQRHAACNEPRWGRESSRREVAGGGASLRPRPGWKSE